MLKRQAGRIMADITECPPATLPAHLARLDDLRELILAACRWEFVEGAESLNSGLQLTNAHTLADYVALLEITRREHRAPAFVNHRDADIAEIKRGLATLAGLLSTHPLIDEITELSGGEL